MPIDFPGSGVMKSRCATTESKSPADESTSWIRLREKLARDEIAVVDEADHARRE
jgi:hypothetical protein